MKPGGCNRSHIPKALEHTTGLPNPETSHEPPVPGSQQAPVTHKPNGPVEKKYIYIRKSGGGGRNCREPLNYNRIHNTTLTEQLTQCNHVGQQRMY